MESHFQPRLEDTRSARVEDTSVRALTLDQAQSGDKLLTPVKPSVEVVATVPPQGSSVVDLSTALYCPSLPSGGGSPGTEAEPETASKAAVSSQTGKMSVKGVRASEALKKNAKGKADRGSDVRPPHHRPTTRPRILFKSEEAPFSNLYDHRSCQGADCSLLYRGFKHVSSEHVYQFEKARRHGEFDLCLKILGPWAGIQSIRTVMRAGQALKTLPIWKEHKLGIMEEIIITKFFSCWQFRTQLFLSGTDLLEEDTSMLFWGANWNKGAKRYGDNQLGRLLMRLRDGRFRYFRMGRTGDLILPHFSPYPVGYPPYVEPRLSWDNMVSDSVLSKLNGVSQYY